MVLYMVECNADDQSTGITKSVQRRAPTTPSRHVADWAQARERAWCIRANTSVSSRRNKNKKKLKVRLPICEKSAPQISRARPTVDHQQRQLGVVTAAIAVDWVVAFVFS